jgi:hypothetical protein
MFDAEFLGEKAALERPDAARVADYHLLACAPNV